MNSAFAIYDPSDKRETELRQLCELTLTLHNRTGKGKDTAKTLGMWVARWADYCNARRLAKSFLRARAKVLAARFGARIRQTVGEDAYRAIRRENVERTLRGDNSCASHDHVDANEVMAEAFAEMLGREHIGEDTLDVELWNEAWRLWRAKDEDAYVASDGGLWYISCDSPPIPTRDYDWCAQHEDYDGDGAEWEPKDDRVMRGKTREDVIEQVEAYVEEHID